MMKFISDNFLKINEPMGRETYFKRAICLIALQVLLVLIYAGVTFMVKIPSQFVLMFLGFMFFIEIPFPSDISPQILHHTMRQGRI